MTKSSQSPPPVRDSRLQVTTREFAMLLGVPEQELGIAAATSRIFRGLALPEPVSKHRGKTRHYWWNDCLDFAEKLDDADMHNNGG